MPGGWFLEALSRAVVTPIYALFFWHVVFSGIVSVAETDQIEPEPESQGLRRFFAVISASQLRWYFAADLILVAPVLYWTAGGVHPTHLLLVRQIVYYFHRYLRKQTFSHLASAISERPARLIASSFLGVILIGAFLLVLPVAVAPGEHPSFLTALFTSTSAVCVTGLIVVDTGSFFSPFGQLVILALIQIGGMGIMTLSAVVGLLLGKRIAITQRTVMQNVLDQSDLSGLVRSLKLIITWTLIVELTGALVLSMRFWSLSEGPFGRALYWGLFHAISAFCNAGFSLLSDSLMGFAEDPVMMVTFILLIVSGGLGFQVLAVVAGYLTGTTRRGPPDVHAYLAVGMSVLLILVGAVMFLILEGGGPSCESLSFPGKMLAALFQSVTTRTAGFNTVDFGALGDPAKFFLTLLMFIGASPGSTGGGIKTTTFAVMLLALWSLIRNRDDVVVLERTIPKETVVRSFLITAIFSALVAGFTFLVLLFEGRSLSVVLFEVVSALATVGLSCNLTFELGNLSRVIIILAMFIGRIGPLTLALVVGSSRSTGNVRYPETKIMVG